MGSESEMDTTDTTDTVSLVEWNVTRGSRRDTSLGEVVSFDVESDRYGCQIQNTVLSYYVKRAIKLPQFFILTDILLIPPRGLNITGGQGEKVED